MSTSTSAKPKASAAGIVERADTQQRVIPESRRADGSVRKERKVRPGFTPVEDVVRYRPVRAREAEEARKKVTSNSTASIATKLGHPASSEAAPPPATSNLGMPDNHRKTWRSIGGTETTMSSQPFETSTPPRGRFAPLELTTKKTKERTPTTTTPLAKSRAPSPGEQPWRNSRLRKPLPSKPSHAETTTAPNALDQEETTQRASPDRIPKQGSKQGRTDASADDLAAELDGLRINSNKDATDK